MNGKTAVSSHTNGVQGQRLRLSFDGADADAVAELFLHWIAIRGTFGVFDLPAEVWNGTANPAVFTPAGYRWKYAEGPQIDEIPCGLHDVALELELVPINAVAGFMEVPGRGVVSRGLAPTISTAGVVLLPPAGPVLTSAPVPAVTGS
jgi:hypothetical protein